MKRLFVLAIAATLVACGSSDPTTTPDGDSDDVTAQGHLSEARLGQLTADLADDSMGGRDEGTAGWTSTRAYIIAELTSCGVQPIAQTFEQYVTGAAGINIIGTIEGTDPSVRDRHILVSAHYDHIGSCSGAICNGANDNASGVAILIGVACEIAAAPLPRSVIVASWDSEEPPTFLTDAMGSEFYAAHPPIPLAQTDVAIVMDIVGAGLWPDFMGHFAIGAELSPLVDAAVSATPVPTGLDALQLGLHMVEQTSGGYQPWSDYDGFRNRNVPVLFLSNGQNKQYHTPADEYSLINVTQMSLQAEYLRDVIVNLGGATQNPTFHANGVNLERDAESLVSTLTSALASNGLVDKLGLTTSSRNALQGDLTRASAHLSTLQGGGNLTAGEIEELRAGVQRVMCLAGNYYSEFLCGMM